MTHHLPAPASFARWALPAAAVACMFAPFVGCGGGGEEKKPDTKTAGGSRYRDFSDAPTGGGPAPDPTPAGDPTTKPPPAKVEDDPLVPLPPLKKRAPAKTEPKVEAKPVKKVSLLRDHEWKARDSITGHTDRIEWAAFSPDGKTVATASRDKTVKLWSALDSREITVFKGHTDRVLCAAFSPDGKTLASGSDDKTVRLWDPIGLKPIGTMFGHAERVKSLVFSPDGKTAASGSADKVVRLWNLAGRTELAALKGHTMPVESVVFAPDGAPVSSGSDGKTGEIILWDVEGAKPKAVWKVAEGKVAGIAVSPDGATLAAACGDRVVRLYDFPAGTLRASLRGHGDAVLSAAFTFDSLLLASGGEDLAAILWDLSENKSIKAFRDQPGFVYFVGFSPNGETLAAASSGGLRLWGAGLGKPPPPTKAEEKDPTSDGRDIRIIDKRDKTDDAPKTLTFANFEPPTTAAMSADGATAFIGFPDYTVGLWSPAQSTLPVRLSGHDGVPAAVSPAPDGKTAAVVGNASQGILEGELKIWDLAKRRPVYTGKTANETYGGVAHSRDGKTLAISVNGYDGGRPITTIRLHGAIDGKLIRACERVPGHFAAVAWSPDGSRVAAAGKAGLQVWNAQSGSPGSIIPGPSDAGFASLAFSPDAALLAAGAGDGTIRLLGPSDLAERGTWKAHVGPVMSVVFASDSRTLVSAGDTTGKVWDVKSGKTRYTFTGHKDSISSLAISRDGRVAVTVGMDRTARLWTTDDTPLPFRKEAAKLP